MDERKFHSLARSLKGELRTDPVFRETFASAGCLYRLRPDAVAIPRGTADTVKTIEFAAGEQIAVTGRGAGSAVAGQALGSGIVINFTKYLNRVLEFQPEQKRVLVQPGLIFAELNRQLKPSGLFFPPDPSSGNYCTIGGMIANNASGAHSLFYGPTQDYLEEMEVILSDGSRAVLGLNKFQVLEQKSSWAANLQEKLNALLGEHKQALEKDRPRVKNASGYLFWGALTPEGVNYARLLAGSEGTLAIILSAWLRLEPIPAFKSAGLIYFQELDSAAKAVLKLRALRPQAIEIMDRNFIGIVREHYPELRPLLDEAAQFMLLVEFDGESAGAALEKIRSANDLVVDKDRLGYKSNIAKDAAEAETLWKVRQSASPILYRLGAGLVRFIEDIVIPPERLPKGITALQKVFAEFKTFAPVMGHAGEGNLHLNPSFNLASKDDRRRMQEMADQVYRMVIGLGGSISGEHGDGMLRAPYVPVQFPAAVRAFQDLKKLFDPQGILNPGKILAGPGLIPLENIKYFAPQSADSPLQKMFAKEKSLELIFKCHGCGLCRSYCPAVTGFESETALPRSKASLARALAQGLVSEDALAGAEAKELLRSCYSCQRCLTLCPTGVQVARIIEQIKNFEREQKLTTPREFLLERSGDLIKLMAQMPSAMPALAASSPARLALSLLGINPQAASLLKPADVGLIQKSKQLGQSAGKKDSPLKIVFFPGCLERWLDPKAFESALKILDALKADYLVLSELCCGMPASQENRELARKAAAKFADRVLPLIQEGRALVCNCPSCLSIFRHNYPALLGASGEAIARSARSIWELKENFGGRYKPTARREFVYHRSCHMIGLGEPDPVLELFKSIPGMNPISVVEQCCGSGGSFELKKENAQASSKISLVLRAELEKAGANLVVSACGLCRRKIRELGFDSQSPAEIIREWKEE